MDTKRLESTAAKALLCSYGVQGTEAELSNLISLCRYDQFALERVGVILRNLAEGQANRINEPDVLEAVINEFLGSDASELAFSFYKGGYIEIGLNKTDFRLGLRLTSPFQQDDISRRLQSQTKDRPESGILPIKHDHALFLTELGELKQAETLLRELAFASESYYYPGGETKSLYQYVARQNLCDVLVLAGKLREAEQIADGMIQAYESDLTTMRGGTQSEILFGRLRLGERCYRRDRGLYCGSNPYARRAVARTLQGKVHQALTDFKQAEAFSLSKLGDDPFDHRVASKMRLKRLGQLIPKETKDKDVDKLDLGHRTLTGQAAIFYALLLTRLGKLDAALKVLNYSKRWAARRSNHLPSMVVYAELALSDVYRLKGEYELAQQNLAHPLEWAKQTHQKETDCWAHLSLARLRYAQNQLSGAENALDEAYKAATTHGFKLYEIDCLVTAGWIAISRQDLVTAEKKAETALKLVSDPDMAYAWGHGNALHLRGQVLFRKDDIQKAQKFSTGAAKLRERIEDPRLMNTQELLSSIELWNTFSLDNRLDSE